MNSGSEVTGYGLDDRS